MKRWIKGFAITGIVLLLIGTAISALAAVVGNIREESFINRWADVNFDDGVLEHIEDVLCYNSYHKRNGQNVNDILDGGIEIAAKEEMKLVGSYQKIMELEIEAEGSAIKIVENPELDHEIRVYLKEESHARVETEAEDGELSVRYSWARRIGYAQGIVEIPAGYQFHKAELKVKAGYLEAAVCSADKLDADVQAGGLRLGSFWTDEAEFSVEAGSLTAWGDIGGSLEAEAKAGTLTLTLKGPENDYNYYLDNAVGNVVIGDSVYSGLSNDQRINNGTNKNVNIDCAAGSVKVKFAEGD